MKRKGLLLLMIGMVLVSLSLAACGSASSAKPNFPTGKFVKPDNRFEGLSFAKDGTWFAFSAGEHLAEGTYSVKGDLYIEETNDQDCPAPMSYKYSFDGTNLKFQLTDGSKNDPCEPRMQGFDGTTYVLGN